MADQIGGASGNATAADLLTGYTASVNSGPISGSMPNEGAVTLTPSGTGTVAIPAGYHNGSGVVAQVSVPTADVLTGTTIAGVAGTMPNNGAPTLQPGSTLPVGYYSGGAVATPTTGSQTWSSPGNFSFTVPTGVTRIYAEIQGSGAAGCNGIGDLSGAAGSVGPGGGGGELVFAFMDVTPGNTIAVTVGAGAVANGGSTVNGNPSSVGPISAVGGQGGDGGFTSPYFYGGSGGASYATYGDRAGAGGQHSSIPVNGSTGTLRSGAPIVPVSGASCVGIGGSGGAGGTYTGPSSAGGKPSTGAMGGGAGGGAGGSGSTTASSGGSYGGGGGSGSYPSTLVGGNGTFGGGGGGGGYPSTYTSPEGGNGGDGYVTITW